MELTFFADLASDRGLQNVPFFIIGAYRNNEVREGHPLNIALELMKKNGVRLYIMDILPFTKHEMTELLWQILGGKDEDVPGSSLLAEYLFNESQGNLFFYFEATTLGAV